MRSFPSLLFSALFLSLLLGSLFVPSKLFAAQVTILPEQKAIIENAEFQTDITIDTGTESINTFSATLSYPANIVTLKEIRTGGSIVNYWVEQPSGTKGAIIFSGMTPGGFTGSHGLLFSAVFTATAQGEGSLQITDPLFLKNDGLGSTAHIAVSNANIQVLAPDVRRNVIIPPVTDTDPPELFTPEISRSPSLMQNAWLLFFATQDKGSGMDHYEVKEYASGMFSFFAPWVRTTSPHLLQDQTLQKHIAIRAVDKAGNIRTVSVLPQNPLPWYANLINWFILVSIVAILVMLKTLLWRKR